MSSDLTQPRSHIHRVRVEFGDGDPAGIVSFPDFHRWTDQSPQHFVKSATYGDELEVNTCVEERNRKTPRQRHMFKRGDDPICVGTELRAFCIKDPETPERLCSNEVPEDIRAAWS